MPDILPEIIPVVILTGFLGAGKTTLLNALLSDETFRGTAVVVNEFGDIAVDNDLIRIGSRELLVTTNGCLCCTPGSDIRVSLFELLEGANAGRAPVFSKVIVETTGLADPAPIVNALIPGTLPAFGMRDHVVARRFRLTQIVTCFDVITGETALKQAFEAVKQVAFASTIVLTKTDLSLENRASPKLAALKRHIASINPSAEIVDRNEANGSLTRIFEGNYLPGDRVDDVTGWLAIDRMLRSEHHETDTVKSSPHTDDIRAISLVHNGPISRASLDILLMLLSNAVGAKLLRMKGLVCLADDLDRPLVVHAVQHLMHPPVRLPAWPDQDRRTRLVIIGRGLDERALTETFRALVANDSGSVRRPWRMPVLGLILFAIAIITGILHVTNSKTMAAVDDHIPSVNGDHQ